MPAAPGHPAAMYGAKVSGQFRRGGNVLNRGLRVLADHRALVAKEEKELVFLDRAADNAAELIALQSIRHGREKVPSIEIVVPEELEMHRHGNCLIRIW